MLILQVNIALAKSDISISVPSSHSSWQASNNNALNELVNIGDHSAALGAHIFERTSIILSGHPDAFASEVDISQLGVE